MTRALACCTLLLAACSAAPKGDGPPREDGGSLPRQDGGGNPAGDGGGNSFPDGGSPGGSAYCGPADATECVCGTMPASGYTLDASCGPSQVGSPSLCCATAAWPGATPGNTFNFECVCSQIFCEIDFSGDVCQCGFGAPTQGDKPVSSCNGYAICCRGRSTVAPTCACYKQNIGCSSDEEQVSSCAPSDLRCSDQTVSACH